MAGRVLSGVLSALDLSEAAPAEPVHCALEVISEGQTRRLALNALLGAGLRIEFLGRISCIHCGRDTRRSYGSGYCYPCFTTLARCDLCVVSPDRCHYHLGTCREPEWGETFCMHDHLVYLANTSGLKVGITRAGREVGRWLDQGAVQALPIAAAGSRRLAGLVEVALARHVSDRTDWQQLTRRDPQPLDLPAAARRLREALGGLPASVRWLESERCRRFAYPVSAYPALPAQLRAPGPAEPAALSGTLLGVKGQYLLLSDGVFNVRRHAGYHVRVELGAEFRSEPADQLALF
jgi:hypothetical protein